MVKEGEAAPEFEARDAEGNTVKLSDLRGQKVALYFYPKDDTPGCTKEACSLRDGHAELTRRGIKVIGVSTDDEKSHRKFAEKYSLPFTLLADTDHKVADAYGAYGEKKFMGRTYDGVHRKTFLIDEAGRVRKVFDKVNVEEHADEVLKAFSEG
ncbi:MAG TPA: thioredoxin-dependent thiol peroxidase [Pyrinomonadaceae bacterium]|jgi:peroxiredoxin Q/BCP|nr:thioredoxin-dependent thiol peroxidase [Pyrinomonadaceae bacterium]